jgi:trk system potassium uptake protein TrkH
MKYSPAKTLVLFFIGLIITGMVFLSLPASYNSMVKYSFFINLFTSVSAVCVTGLSIVNIGEYYSKFGQIIILLLVQISGMGYMFVSTVLTLLLGKIALKDRRIMQEMFEVSSFNGLKRLLSKAMLFVLAIEFIGTISLTVVFLKNFSFLKSVYLGIFYSVMAFCNAGFSIFNESMVSFSQNPAILYIISLLVLLGGLGFFVIIDIYDYYKEKRLHLSIHTKVVLSMSLIVTIFAFIVFLFSKSVGGHGFFYLINNAFFEAVSSRTAGFCSVPINLFNEFTEAIIIFFMSIGAAPGSTAGGVKVTTLALVFIFVKSVLVGDEDYVLFKRRIPFDLIKKALVVFIIFFALIFLFSTLVILHEDNLRPISVVFEVVSALATVGMSLGITEELSLASKIYIIIAMLVGRIGILTLFILMLDPGYKKKNIKYPEGRILVG